MILSYSKKFIFIHIDKTAGTSMKTSLLKYAWYPHESVINTILKKLGMRYYSEEFYDHIRAIELEQHLPEKTFRNFFKFAFVRNPWDWMLSSYTYYLRNKDIRPHAYFKDQINSLEDFINWQVNNAYAYHTQSEYIIDKDKKLLVDFVGRFESIDEEFKKICKIIGIQENLPHLNLSKDKGYEGYYNDRTKDLIYKNYKTDIELFGYEF